MAIRPKQIKSKFQLVPSVCLAIFFSITETDTLSVRDRVVDETLRIKTPFVLQYMDQLMGAMVSALGSHLGLLASVKEHPRSHGIIAESWQNSI